MAKNFLLGRGENLTADFDYRSGGGGKHIPLTFDKAIELLTPKIKSTEAEIRSLPKEACPNDNGVFQITLHPTFMARSHILELLEISRTGNHWQSRQDVSSVCL